MDNMGRTFQVIEDDITFDFEAAEEGGYTVTVPDLPGCVSEGDTFEEALAMIKDAMVGWLMVARKHGDPFPRSIWPCTLSGARCSRSIRTFH